LHLKSHAGTAHGSHTPQRYDEGHYLEAILKPPGWWLWGIRRSNHQNDNALRTNANV